MRLTIWVMLGWKPRFFDHFWSLIQRCFHRSFWFNDENIDNYVRDHLDDWECLQFKSSSNSNRHLVDRIDFQSTFFFCSLEQFRSFPHFFRMWFWFPMGLGKCCSFVMFFSTSSNICFLKDNTCFKNIQCCLYFRHWQRKHINDSCSSIIQTPSFSKLHAGLQLWWRHFFWNTFPKPFCVDHLCVQFYFHWDDERVLDNDSQNSTFQV